MKKLLGIIVLTLTGTLMHGQKPIDQLFEKYSGKEGFVTFTINGDLLKLFCKHDEGNHENNSLPANVSEIRIIAEEDNHQDVENFYDFVINRLNLSNYEEFMRIKESDKDVRMLVKTEGRNFKEFLLVSGGEDNILIQIKGNMTFGEAKKFSEEAKMNHGLNVIGDN